MKTVKEYGEELEKILYGKEKVFSYLEIEGNKAIIEWADDAIRKTEIEIIDKFCNENGLDWQLSSEGEELGELYINEHLSRNHLVSNINIEIWIKQKKEN